ncbi:D-galactoside-specific lectin-like, partial [Mya arenaria]|uniref:D-galactoside-specific lectin-like n=1 Tax=Mya arenaria TaxID=6604 RepID=UPI0022E34C76
FTTPVSGDAIYCEESTGHIRCPAGQKNAVYNAYYGRTHNGTICPHSLTSNQTCHATGSLDKIQSACQNQQQCYLAANYAVYGDPCRGTFKYIEVKFVCL